MKHKLVLVNPVNPARTGLTVNKSSRFPPIGLGIVAALTPETWDVALVDENWEPFAYQEADPSTGSGPSLVGITAFTASAKRAYEIAAAYRERGVPVVMGGIHASMCTEEALQYVDAVVVGEAEAVWPQVVADVEAGQLQRVYQGEWTDMAGSPRPRRDLFHPGYLFASVQTSRGCPMDCEFCSVTAFNGRRYRRRPPAEVLDELETIPQKMLFFV
ncbi:MAG: cobalamin-dependent protein, partial [Thermoflexales bacterium]|nr:cobalamin-dependent protein [Thermoflexales bacterium]